MPPHLRCRLSQLRHQPSTPPLRPGAGAAVSRPPTGTRTGTTTPVPQLHRLSTTNPFEDKANAPGAGAIELIRMMQKELQAQADAFRAAAKDYRSTDDQIAQDLQRGIQ